MASPLPDIYSLASDETCRGGYLITEDPEAPVMILTVPLPLNDKFGDAAHLSVSVPPEMLQAGQFYLIGDPWSSRARWSGSRENQFPASRGASDGTYSGPSEPDAARLERGCAE